MLYKYSLLYYLVWEDKDNIISNLTSVGKEFLADTSVFISVVYFIH